MKYNEGNKINDPHKPVLEIMKRFSSFIKNILNDYKIIFKKSHSAKYYWDEKIKSIMDESLEDTEYLNLLKNKIQRTIESGNKVHYNHKKVMIITNKVIDELFDKYKKFKNNNNWNNLWKKVTILNEYWAKIAEIIDDFVRSDKEIWGIYEINNKAEDIGTDEYKEKILNSTLENLTILWRKKIWIDFDHFWLLKEYRKVVLWSEFFYERFIIAHKKNIIGQYLVDNQNENDETIDPEQYEKEIERLNKICSVLHSYTTKFERNIVDIELRDDGVPLVRDFFDNVGYCTLVNELFDWNGLGVPWYGKIDILGKSYQIQANRFDTNTEIFCDVKLCSENQDLYPSILLDFTFLDENEKKFHEKKQNALKRDERKNSKYSIAKVIPVKQYADAIKIIQENIINYIQWKDYSLKINNKFKYELKKAIENIINSW